MRFGLHTSVCGVARVGSSCNPLGRSFPLTTDNDNRPAQRPHSCDVGTTGSSPVLDRGDLTTLTPKDKASTSFLFRTNPQPPKPRGAFRMSECTRVRSGAFFPRFAAKLSRISPRAPPQETRGYTQRRAVRRLPGKVHYVTR